MTVSAAVGQLVTIVISTQVMAGEEQIVMFKHMARSLSSNKTWGIGPIDFCAHVWQCLITSGHTCHIWSCLVTFGHVWYHLIIPGDVY